jgi:hypothetical protein
MLWATGTWFVLALKHTRSRGTSMLPVIGMAVTGILFVGFAVWYFVENYQPSKAPEVRQSETDPRSGRPILESTDRAKIDAAGAEIPQEFPGQLAHASDDSQINMPGLKITRKEDGSFSIKGGNWELPPPSGEYLWLSAPELKTRMVATIADLLKFQDQFSKDFQAALRITPRDYPKVEAVRNKYLEIYRDKFSTVALSLTSAAINKTGALDVSGMSIQVQHGQSTLRFNHFVSFTPGIDVAAFLQVLSDRLPAS